MSSPIGTRYLPIEVIIESKTNPRKTFEPGKEKELTESIKVHGIIEPLLVRPLASGQIEIVDGARRFRAAKAAGLTELPGIVREYSDEEVMEIQLISFTQRVDIHPLEEAEAYEKLQKKHFVIEEIANKVGKERSYIAKRLQLVTLIDPAKKAFRENGIFLGHAILIARLQPKDQEKALSEAIEMSGESDMPVSVDSLARFIRQEFELDLRKAGFDKKDALLVEAAGSCTNCPKRSGYNKDLFNDITAADHCMDPRCFEGKMKAHIQIRLSELNRKGENVVLITPELRKPEGYPESITCRSYSVVKAGSCEYTKAGLVVGGPSRGKVETICNERTCTKHRGGHSRGISSVSSKPKSPEAAEKERLKRVKEGIDREVNDRLQEALFPLLAKALPGHLRRQDLEQLREVVASNLYGGYEQKALKLIGVKGDCRKWSDKQLAKAIMLLLLGIRIDDGYDGVSPGQLEAKNLGIDIAPIEKAVRAEVEKLYAEELKSKLPDKCRICGCTENSSCLLPKVKEGKMETCSWVDGTKTLCSNPKCLSAAKKASAPAKKKSKK